MDGLLTIYKLTDTTQPGMTAKESLAQICTAYYTEQTLGVTRAYAAMSAKQQIDMLVKVYNTELTTEAEYVIPEDGNQYRISLKQVQGDGSILLTLERLEGYYDVAD